MVFSHFIQALLLTFVIAFAPLAQASESGTPEITLTPRQQLSHSKGGAANGGRSCLNPEKLLRQGSLKLDSWGEPHVSTPSEPVSEVFTSSLQGALPTIAELFPLGTWSQSDCSCVKLAGRQIRIVEATRDSLLLETGHRVSRAGSGLRLDYFAQAKMTIDCDKILRISKILEERHDIHVTFLLEPKVLPQDFSDHLQRSDDLQEETKLLCEDGAAL